MRNQAYLASLFIFLGTGLLATPASAETITVKQGGGGDFTQIQDAVDHASNGDLILVYASSQAYNFFTVNGKALLIRGVGSTPVNTKGGLIRNIPLGEYLGLENLKLYADETIPGLKITGNQGSVAVFKCLLNSHYPYYAYANAVGLQVFASTDVKIVDCSIQGAEGLTVDCCNGGDGASGVSISGNSLVAIYGSSLRGGDGGENGSISYPNPGGDGGDGVQVTQGSFLFLSASKVYGGDGACGGLGCNVGAGGNGLVALDSSEADVLASNLVHGYGNPIGSDWLGNVQFLTGTGPELKLLPPLPPSVNPWVPPTRVTARLSVKGTPGDDVFILVSGESQFANSIASLRGILHVEDTLGDYAGVIPAGGTLTIDFPLPSGSLDRIYLQAMSMTSGHVRTLSNPILPILKN